MIQPEDIRRKAENLYSDYIRSWLSGDECFFPKMVRAQKMPDAGNFGGTIQSIQRLRENSKEAIGFGYSVEWQEINSRKFGRNRFPARILFETPGDFLQFLGKQREFDDFKDAVTRLRRAFPTLKNWILANVRVLMEVTSDLDGLLCVLQYFHDNPRPNLFARELPIAVDTKFIERYQGLLQQWLDIVLPPHTIRAEEDRFERRYGLRYAEPHLLVRLLDSTLEHELGYPCSEFSLPLRTLAAMSISTCTAIIVENKVNLLTLPAFPRGIGLGGLGCGVVLLRDVSWLNHTRIVYWGDIDTAGLEILSSLRAIFPHTQSFLMDFDALERWRHLAVVGNGQERDAPFHLTETEQQAFLCCRDENLRIEQERIPQHEVLNEVKRLFSLEVG